MLPNSAQNPLTTLLWACKTRRMKKTTGLDTQAARLVDRLEELRAFCGENHGEFAKRLGVDAASYSRFRNGRRKMSRFFLDAVIRAYPGLRARVDDVRVELEAKKTRGAVRLPVAEVVTGRRMAGKET